MISATDELLKSLSREVVSSVYLRRQHSHILLTIINFNGIINNSDSQPHLHYHYKYICMFKSFYYIFLSKKVLTVTTSYLITVNILHDGTLQSIHRRSVPRHNWCRYRQCPYYQKSVGLPLAKVPEVQRPTSWCVSTPPSHQTFSTRTRKRAVLKSEKSAC